MSVELNLASVRAEHRDIVEKHARERFPKSAVKWTQGQPGFIVLGIPAGDYGSSADIDALGRTTSEPEDGGSAVIAGLEEELQRLLRILTH